MSERPIHYEPHPVSRERKAELIAAGFRIVDAKFAPKGGLRIAIETSYGSDEVAAPESTPLVGVIQTTDEMKAALTAKGVKFRANASRATLAQLLNQPE
jgi:hypothetical protein